MLISLDATSLYTRDQFIDAVKLITTESYFRYQDHYYLQRSGLAMGNSISGQLANMVMNDLETTTLRNLPFVVTF